MAKRKTKPRRTAAVTGKVRRTGYTFGPAQRRRAAGARRRTGKKGKAAAPQGQVLLEPGQEEVLAGTPTPFLSGEDIIERARTEGSWTEELGALGAQILEAQGQRDLGHHQLGLEQGKRLNQTSEATAGRGLLRSSIQQHALTDITADIQQRRSALDSALSAAQSRFQTRLVEIDNERQAAQVGYDLSAVENAAAISPTQTHLQKGRPARYGPAPGAKGAKGKVAAGAKRVQGTFVKQPAAPVSFAPVAKPGQVAKPRPKAFLPKVRPKPKGAPRPRERGARSRNPAGRH